jgi:enoyl-CoA hydratase/carnithine racemase
LTIPDQKSPVLYDARDSGVAVVTLNRPERMNAWGGGLAAEFYRCMDRAEADPSVRVVVVTGSGRAFCAGADMGDLDTIGGAGDADVSQLVGDRHPHFVTTLRKPVIAAINGACAGIGLTQALMCDVRFAAAGAKFTTAFACRSLIGEYAISWILPRVVGWSAALDLLLSGRTFYAEEAAANCAPSAMAVIKRQVYDDALRDLVATSAHAETLMHESMSRPDFIEGITAFFEKRAPNFPPLSEVNGSKGRHQ